MENEELSDSQLFDEALGDQGESQEQVEQTSEQQEEQQEQQATETTQEQRQQVDDNAAQVPSWRVREINEEKRRLAEENERFKAELAEMRRSQPRQPEKQETEKAKKPDPLLDPEAYEAYLEKRFEERLAGERDRMLNERREESLQNAAEKYKDEFKEAYSEAQKRVDPALKARMQESRNPGETLIQWHREQKAMREVGTDPNAWLEKKLEERLKDPAFLAKAVELARGSASGAPRQNVGQSRVQLPPSLSAASRSNAALRGDDTSEVSDRELFQQIAG